MKKTNKGFSLVELIIVIAIMAILAGALAPALIKYINKSRLSTDVQTGQTIATGIQTALSNEGAYDDAKDYSTPTDYDTFVNGQGASMKAELTSVIGDSSKIAMKSKKDVKGTTFTAQKFYVSMIATSNEIKVYAGSTSADHMVYPTVGTNMTSK